MDLEEICAVRAVHVLPDEQGWVLRKSDRDRVNQVFATKTEAIQFAR